MNKERVIYAIILSSILLTVGLWSVFGGRIITSDSDDILTKIRTSGGDVYDAIGSNIQLAIWSLNATGGTVWLPAGILYHSTYIYLYNHTALIGAGMGITIIKSAAGNNVGKIRALKTGYPLQHNITVKDLTIECNSSSGNGITFYNVTDFTIQNVEIRNCGYNALSLSRNCTYGTINNYNSYISDALHTGSYHSLAVDQCYDSTFTDIYIKKPYSSGFDFSSCHNITVDGLKVVDSDGYGGKVYSGMSGDPRGGNNTFNNIHIYNCDTTASVAFRVTGEDNDIFTNIRVLNVGYYGMSFETCYDTILDNFIIENCASIGLVAHDARYSNTKSLMISNGQIRNTTSRGIDFDDLHNFTMTNVQVEFFGSTPTINDCKDFALRDCKFSNGVSSDHGLIINDCSYFRVLECTFAYNTLDGLDMTDGLGCHNYTIKGCTFKYNTGIGLDCGAADDWVIITHNFFISDTLDDHYTSKGLVEKNIGDDI